VYAFVGISETAIVASAFEPIGRRYLSVLSYAMGRGGDPVWWTNVTAMTMPNYTATAARAGTTFSNVAASSKHNAVAVVGESDVAVLALDTGALLWRRAFNETSPCATLLMDDSGTIYVYMAGTYQVSNPPKYNSVMARAREIIM
jgi:hypothetical protein